MLSNHPLTNAAASLPKKISLLVMLVFCSLWSAAQNPTDSVPGDPGALSVYTIQHLSFGAFSIGSSGGTVIISTAGMRSVTGDVVPLNFGVSFHQAIFDIDAPQGSIISMMNGSDAVLTGSNGGSFLMRIGDPDPPSPFITIVPQPARTTIQVGGKITLGTPAMNPPGTYTGTFYITFNQE